MPYVLVVVLISSGVSMIVKPEIWRRIEHWFSVRGGEPTDAYLFLQRVCGVFIIIVAVVGLLVPK